MCWTMDVDQLIDGGRKYLINNNTNVLNQRNTAFGFGLNLPKPKLALCSNVRRNDPAQSFGVVTIYQRTTFHPV